MRKEFKALPDNEQAKIIVAIIIGIAGAAISIAEIAYFVVWARAFWP